MQLAMRPWITAGVALTGAGMIAVSPVSPPLPDITMPSVQLTAADGGIIDSVVGTWGDTFGAASTNAAEIFNHFAAAPLPVLQQILVNQVGYLDDLVTNPAGIFDQIGDHLSAVGTALVNPFVTPDATDALYNSLDASHQDFFEIIQQFAIPGLTDNADLQSLLHGLVDFAASPLSGVLLGTLGTGLSPVLQFGSDVTGIADALGGADFGTAFQDVLNMPANMIDAFLNGYGTVDLVPLLAQLGITLPSLPLVPGLDSTITSLPLYMGGLLSAGGSILQAVGTSADVYLDGSFIDNVTLATGEAVGPIASLVEFAQSIAVALGWDGVGNPLADLLTQGGTEMSTMMASGGIDALVNGLGTDMAALMSGELLTNLLTMFF
ncbi:outer membrane porin GjpA [Mycobacterium sp. pUA109]|uniref:outer membrane porin GjpA n=1 Tax=Mycobacterium sp. pUA109 TaxID=3238982 RepID=UPI00351BE90C